jgi:predicted phosphodiesterase
MLLFPTDFLIDAILHFAIGSKHADSSTCLYVSYPDYIPKEVPRSNLPACADGSIRILFVSDTHDRHNGLGILPECDILLHCGDIMMTNRFFSNAASVKKLNNFNSWLGTVRAKQRLVIGGNHDRLLEVLGKEKVQSILTNGVYLLNENVQLGNLTAWASPLSAGKSRNRAFQSAAFTKEVMQKRPEEVDVLITHGRCGALEDTIKHKVHLWGHNHNSYGVYLPGDIVQGQKARSLSICASLMDGHYNLKNLPVVLDLPRERADLAVPTPRTIATSIATPAPSSVFNVFKTRKYKVQPIIESAPLEE